MVVVAGYKIKLPHYHQLIPYKKFDRSAKPLADHNHNLRSRDLDVVQRDFAPVYGPVGRGLTGLKNLGNTCYMNSILQCLSNTYFLNEFFHDPAYKTRLNRNNKTQGKIGEEVAAVIRALWTGQYKCIASKNLRYVVGQYERQFGGIEQQDSHEFLTILMDWLHSDLQTTQMHMSTSFDKLPPSEKAWIEHFKGKSSYISDLFYGQIKSTVKCKRCEQESATYESFSNLSLELPQDSNICYLENCLDMYFHGEEVRGWHCPKCKSNQDAIKKLDISRLPSILVVHFKRFYADPDAMSTVYRKKQTLVKFPLNELNMTHYLARTEVMRNQRLTTHRYHLYGVSNHYGSMESGHYTAFCLNSVHQKWFKFDDYNVSSIDASDVQASAAYILFYSLLPVRPQSDVR
ncbi:AGAP002900-PA-like protein [Anopheles sinensis]|uniref:Ubiquitin carboxyl-terminal hydrolase n=1 Tax=Anopheles sinensis TaxID=74873 RepID=A0A084VE32_ANOSI|nr:AGAP002900-PA-like protein [Anopheles sinensis]